ncbi:multidrug effflux MFS transporter [Celeribacter marinus]|nr:multidrug effflux MFS transporter [Celeribacter marinus]SFK01438.1 MFS transporter, DHA1 family, bicyclomycin/chloramphenicol resistance protein [Celeribacter marinus]
MTQIRARFLDRTTPPHIMTLVMMAGLQAMTMNIYLPALPRMADHFGTTYGLIQLSVAVFMATNAVLQIFIGPISDRYGRRPVVLIGIALFLLATLGVIYAPTLEAFLIMRAGQAAIVTAMVLSRAIVRDIAPPEEAGSMLAYVTMGMALVPMIAPTVGGLLTNLYGWESSFWVLFGVGVLLLMVVWFDLKETAPKSDVSLLGQIHNFPELITSKRFIGYTLSVTCASGAFFAYIGGAAYVGKTLFGLSEAKLGLYMGTPALGYFFGNFIAGRYSRRVGINRMILAGGIVATSGIFAALVFSVVGHSSVNIFFGAMVFLGLGNGMQIPNGLAGSMMVRPQLAGTAAGLGGSIMLAGGASISAFAGTLLGGSSGEIPLLFLMTLMSLAAIVAILSVMAREHRLGLA